MTTQDQPAGQREALLPCPHCGGPAKVFPVRGYWEKEPQAFRLICDTTMCTAGFIAKTREEVIAAWNKRHPTAERDGGRWISVNDRLPEVGQMVLGWDERVQAVWVYDFGDTRGPNRREFPKWFKVSGDKPSRDVTHWMPLPPKPPMPAADKGDGDAT